ncbi:MAG: (2Fe-2S)-binding protein [Myxococcota bacterium]|jgi:NAD(P)H-nitrite reductase large subunit
MLVCHCFVIRACDVRSAIAHGARTPADVARACHAGTGCGGCRPVIEEILAAQTGHCGGSEFAAGDARANPRSTMPR